MPRAGQQARRAPARSRHRRPRLRPGRTPPRRGRAGRAHRRGCRTPTRWSDPRQVRGAPGRCERQRARRAPRRRPATVGSSTAETPSPLRLATSCRRVGGPPARSTSSTSSASLSCRAAARATAPGPTTRTSSLPGDHRSSGPDSSRQPPWRGGVPPVPRKRKAAATRPAMPRATRARRSRAIVGLAGIEPATSPLSEVRSNRLSYSPGQTGDVSRGRDVGASRSCGGLLLQSVILTPPVRSLMRLKSRPG